MKKLLKRLEKLIAVGDELKEKYRTISSKDDKEREDFVSRKNAWLLSCTNFFEKTGMNTFKDNFEAIQESHSGPTFKTAELIGTLKSAYEEIEEGFIYKIEHVLHADLFDSIIEQAEELLKSGHKIPAAVLARIVIEKWLFDFAEQNRVATSEEDKASKVNDSLKNEGIFATPKWRIVQSHLDVGNSAAHGKNEEFSEENVKSMFEFIKNTCF